MIVEIMSSEHSVMFIDDKDETIVMSLTDKEKMLLNTFLWERSTGSVKVSRPWVVRPLMTQPIGYYAYLAVPKAESRTYPIGTKIHLTV